MMQNTIIVLSDRFRREECPGRALGTKCRSSRGTMQLRKLQVALWG